MLIETLSSGEEKSKVITSPYSPGGVALFGIVGLIDKLLLMDRFDSMIDGAGYVAGTAGGTGGDGISFSFLC